jgi:MoxR-like ATPase
MTVATSAATPQGVIDAGLVARLAEIERELGAALVEREAVTHLALVCLLARQHMVLLGPPGTGKSYLVERLLAHIGGAGGFDILMTRFTTPDEVLGPVSLAAMKAGLPQERITALMLPEAHLAFFDEVWKASSAILNALLMAMNERAVRNAGRKQAIPLMTIFGASNEMPQGDDLSAAWDRFLVRVVVGYVSERGFRRLLTLAPPPPTVTVTLDELTALQRAASAVLLPDSLLDALEALRKALLAEGIAVSDRRWQQSMGLIRAAALMDGRATAEEDDLAVLAHVCWTQPEQQPRIAAQVGKLANPLNQRATELADDAKSVYDLALAKWGDRSLKAEERASMVVAQVAKLNTYYRDITAVYRQAQAEGRGAAKIEALGRQVREWKGDLTQRATSAMGDE